jgi:hypothetical protein
MYGGFEITTATVPSSSGSAIARSVKIGLAEVLFRPHEGERRHLHAVDAGVRHLGRHGERDGAAPRAEVDGDGPFDELRDRR